MALDMENSDASCAKVIVLVSFYYDLAATHDMVLLSSTFRTSA